MISYEQNKVRKVLLQFQSIFVPPSYGTFLTLLLFTSTVDVHLHLSRRASVNY